jgi:transcriptional regulator with XRE-family HTH domain
VDTPTDLGKRLRAAREYAGMNGAQAAKILGWSNSNYQRLEAGTRELKDWESDALLPRMAKACGVPADWFTAPWPVVGTTVTEAHPDQEPEWVGELRDQVEFIMSVIRKVHPKAAAEVISERIANEASAAPAAARRRRAS